MSGNHDIIEHALSLSLTILLHISITLQFKHIYNLILEINWAWVEITYFRVHKNFTLTVEEHWEYS